jgi:hypothetical protein
VVGVAYASLPGGLTAAGCRIDVLASFIMEASSEFVPPILLDHLAIMQPRTPPAASQPRADLPKMLDLARRQNAVIKAVPAGRRALPPDRPPERQ